MRSSSSVGSADSALSISHDIDETRRTTTPHLEKHRPVCGLPLLRFTFLHHHPSPGLARCTSDGLCSCLPASTLSM